MSGAMVVLAIAIPVLGYVGFHKVLTSTEGRRVDAQNDPSKPNFEVNVIPTPVMLFELADANGVHSITLLSLGAEDIGGGVLFIPVDTVTEDVIAPTVTSSTSSGSSTSTTTTTTSSTTVPGAAPTTPITLEAAFAEYGQPGLEQLTANVLGLSFGEVAALNDDQLVQFVAPALPVTIENPDRIVEVGENGRTSVAFPAGTLTLEAADVPRYMRLTNPGESDLARLDRQQRFWQAWLAAVRASSDPNVIPGETGTGLGRYVRGLSRGDAQLGSLPASAQQTEDGEEIFVPEAEATAALLDRLVPLPTPANPGDRVRVRLLSGVGALDPNALLATDLVPAHDQVTIVGNADRFDYDTTRIVYYDDEFAAAAAELQSLLGVGEVTKSTTPADSEDVTVIIGQDLVTSKGLDITKEETGSG